MNVSSAGFDLLLRAPINKAETGSPLIKSLRAGVWRGGWKRMEIGAGNMSGSFLFKEKYLILRVDNIALDVLPFYPVN